MSQIPCWQWEQLSQPTATRRGMLGIVWTIYKIRDFVMTSYATRVHTGAPPRHLECLLIITEKHNLCRLHCTSPSYAILDLELHLIRLITETFNQTLVYHSIILIVVFICNEIKIQSTKVEVLILDSYWG